MGERGSDEDRSATRPLRVLVVDDDHDTAESLEIFLRHAGHHVTVAHDGLSGLKAARGETPDVVILDIGLPECDGYEVARRLRREASLADVTLVALSGYGTDGDVGQSRAAGFDYHLVKPVEAELLQEIIAARGGLPERLGPRRVERLTPARRTVGKP